MRFLALAVMLLAGAACAQETNPADDAMNAGVAADIGSTAAAVAAGLQEANPLGLAVLPLKMATRHMIDAMPDENRRREASAQFTGVQFGAAAWNFCTLAAANPPIAVACAASGAVLAYKHVKAQPTRREVCLAKHQAAMETAAAAGRTYVVELTDCSGHFLEPGPPRVAATN